MHQDQIKEIVRSPDQYAPALLMASAALDFKRLYEHPIRTVRTTEEVRDLVAYYISLRSLEHCLVIEDLSFLQEQASFLLLKLVEESEFPVVLLSTFDKVSPIILSRIKTFVKYSKEKTTSDFLDVEVGISRLLDLSPDSHYFDRVKNMARNCPKLYFYEASFGKVRNREKIIRILG